MISKSSSNGEKSSWKENLIKEDPTQSQQTFRTQEPHLYLGTFYKKEHKPPQCFQALRYMQLSCSAIAG